MKVLNFLFLLISFVSLSQNCPYLGPDQFLSCGVNSTTLTADFSQCGPGSNPNQTTNYGVTNIPYVAQTNTGTQLFMSDDSQQGPFNIGFTFCFFGQTYNQFWVGSNGWISFSPAQPTTFTSATIPSGGATIPKNCIMGPWQDWHPGLGGQIRYQVQGITPCRKLVVSWVGVPMFSCTNLQGTFSIVIYESTNIIENHIQSKPNCLAWAGGTAVQGLHNTIGTVAITVPGRNSTQWTANNEAYRYTPSGPAVTPTPTWYLVGNPNPIGVGTSITVNPPSQGANYTCHLVYPTCNAGWNTCNNISGNGPDTVFVQPGPPSLNPPTVNITNPTCYEYCDGIIGVTPTNGAAPFTYLWNTNEVTPIISNLCDGTYTFLLSDSQGCTYNGSATLTNPPQFVINPINGIQPDTLCIGSSNNPFQVNDLNPNPIYTWNTTQGSISNTQTNQITVDINGMSTGFYDDFISVYGTDVNGCQSQTEVFDVFVLDVNPTIDPISPLCEYDDCVPLNTNPVGGVLTGSNIFNNQFCPDSTVVGTTPITYTYTQAGCVFDTIINVTVKPRPIVNNVYNNLGANGYQFSEVCEGEELINTYNASTTGGLNTWYVFGDTIYSQNLILTWDEEGSYNFYVITEENGCFSLPYDYNVAIQDCPVELIYIPNSFTPDGDEFNQNFLPIMTEGFDPYDFNLTIFNRWGETVFESSNHLMGWDGSYNGEVCQDGTYIWRIEYGVLENDKRVVKHGHLTLIR